MDARLYAARRMAGAERFVSDQLIVEFGDPAMVGDGVEMLLRSPAGGATHSHPQERLVNQAGQFAGIFVGVFRRTEKPVSGVTTSRMPLTSLATIGSAEPCASINTRGRPSNSEGNSATSAAASTAYGSCLPTDQRNAIGHCVSLDLRFEFGLIGPIPCHDQPPTSVWAALAQCAGDLGQHERLLLRLEAAGEQDCRLVLR